MALVLAFGVVGALLAVTIGVVVVHGVTVVTTTESGLLGSVLGGAIAAVAGYIGHVGGGKDGSKDDGKPPELE